MQGTWTLHCTVQATCLVQWLGSLIHSLIDWFIHSFTHTFIPSASFPHLLIDSFFDKFFSFIQLISGYPHNGQYLEPRGARPSHAALRLPRYRLPGPGLVIYLSILSWSWSSHLSIYSILPKLASLPAPRSWSSHLSIYSILPTLASLLAPRTWEPVARQA